MKRRAVGIGILAIVFAVAIGFFAGRTLYPNTNKTQPQTTKPSKQERKILYYRNPMGLADTSPVPKKDPMGMDYIPVFADEESTHATANIPHITISNEKVQKLGVRTEAAAFTTLERTVSAAARIDPDERRIYSVTAKFEGYIEQLWVNTTGQFVQRGQPLFSVYAPELVSTQHEYAIAAQGVDAFKESAPEARASMKQLAAAALTRLRNWDISDAQLKALAASAKARQTLALQAPVSGIVVEKKAIQGMRFMPGDPLYQIADLSTVWAIADIFEQDIAAVTVGSPVHIDIDAYPDKTFTGTVSYVYPTLKSETRTIPVRIALANPGLLLKPGMFARVTVHTPGKTQVLSIPTSAVIDSGAQQRVLVQTGEGRYAAREVKLGMRTKDRVEVLAGLSGGESVVVSANFLIDAESNLKAALDHFAPAAQSSPAAHGTTPARVGHTATGKIEAVDAKSTTVRIAHAPIADLKWPAMTMDFKVTHTAQLQSLHPGDQVTFEFVERGPGEWVIIRVSPILDSHSGH